MKNIVKTLINILTGKNELIVCPCGHKSSSRKSAVRHLATHPGGIGSMDVKTGAVSW